MKNLMLLNQPNDSSNTALKLDISENGSDRYHFGRTGRTGTISAPQKSEFALMNSTLELFFNSALSRAK